MNRDHLFNEVCDPDRPQCGVLPMLWLLACLFFVVIPAMAAPTDSAAESAESGAFVPMSDAHLQEMRQLIDTLADETDLDKRYQMLQNYLGDLFVRVYAQSSPAAEVDNTIAPIHPPTGFPAGPRQVHRAGPGPMPASVPGSMRQPAPPASATMNTGSGFSSPALQNPALRGPALNGRVLSPRAAIGRPGGRPSSAIPHRGPGPGFGPGSPPSAYAGSRASMQGPYNTAPRPTPGNHWPPRSPGSTKRYTGPYPAPMPLPPRR